MAKKIYREGKNSTFTSNGKTYGLDGIFEATHKYSITVMPVSKLSWVIPYTNPDADRIDKADVKVPIIVVRDLSQPAAEQFIVVDGLHRLARAIRDGLKVIPTKLISKALLAQYEIK